MADALEKQVENFLQAGESKKSILRKLEDETNYTRLLYYLNNKSVVPRRHKYMWINLLLSFALLAMTLRLLMGVADIIALRGVGLYLLAEFIVPTVNFYIIKELLQFHRNGYQFLVVLTALALIIHPANRLIPDIFINLGMIALGAFLYLKLFPREEILKHRDK